MRRLWIAVGALAGLIGCFSVPTGQPVAISGPARPANCARHARCRRGTCNTCLPSARPSPLAPWRILCACRWATGEFAFEQIVAVIEEYFKVQHEEPVRVAGDILTEGRIDTYPEISATLLEPWRGDSVTFHDRLESTLQTYRRRGSSA